MRRPLTPDGQDQFKWLKWRTKFCLIGATVIAVINAVYDVKSIIQTALAWLVIVGLCFVVFMFEYFIIKLMDSRRAPPTIEDIEHARQVMYGPPKDDPKT